MSVSIQEHVMRELADLAPAQMERVLALITSLKRSPTVETLLSLFGRTDVRPQDIDHMVDALIRSGRADAALHETLQQMAEFKLPPQRQRRLSRLLDKNQAGELKPREQTELDELLAKVEVWTLKKTQARHALKRLLVAEQARTHRDQTS
jgi:hypothetical protein